MLARIFGSKSSKVDEVAWDSEATPNVVKRRQMALEELPERNEILNTAYQYWHSIRRNGLLPARKDIDILQVRKIIKHTHLVDVSSTVPDEWGFRVVGSVIPQTWVWGVGRDKIADCPWPPYRDMLIQDYGTVKFTGAPVYHELAVRLDWVAHYYARIVLPLAEDGRNVETLMSCVVFHDKPGLDL